MDCSNCGTVIPPNERFCRNCGHEAVPPSGMREPQPTLPYAPAQITDNLQFNPSAQRMYPSSPSFPVPHAATPEPSRTPLLMILVIALIVVAVGGAGGVGYVLWSRSASDRAGSNNVLPDHFGIFLKSDGALNELRRRDYTDALQARDAMVGERSLPMAEAKPTLIVYAEPQDIPVADLKLVQLDSINSEGRLRHWNYHVAPIDGQPNMKQIRVAGGLSSGKYAFALFNGYLNEGNHRFWPFEVEVGGPEPSESPQLATVQVKASPSPSPLPKTQPTPKPPTSDSPPGARPAYCNDTNVIVRSAPDLNARPIGKLNRGQKVWVLGTSSNYSTWKGLTSNWTQVQIHGSSVRGWVFSPFISYN